jgi:NADPH:quinone reductase
LPDPSPDKATAIVEVEAGSITASDVKNVQGKMEGTTLPRVPGRDYAGTVVDGPAEWMGAEVWGNGGEIGYSINGSHAELIAVPIASLRCKNFGPATRRERRLRRIDASEFRGTAIALVQSVTIQP